MKLHNFTVENFKNYEKASIQLEDFNAIVGLNSSGKSNLVSAFKFLDSCFSHGFQRAVSIAGGWGSISSFYSDFVKSPIRFEAEFIVDPKDMVNIRAKEIEGSDGTVLATNVTVKVEITRPSIKGSMKYEYIINVLFSDRSELLLKWDSRRGNKRPITVEGSKSLLDAFNLTSIAKFLEKDTPKTEKAAQELDDIFRTIIRGTLSINFSFDDVGIYNFDPKLASQVLEGGYTTQLDKNGKNFANVIASMSVEDSKRFRKQFLLPLQSFYPTIVDVKSKLLESGSYLTLFEEEYGTKHLSLPMNRMSEGILFISLIIAAVKFGSDHMIVIEEPERYIHPSLLERLIKFLRSSAISKQIILTTHSPIVVRSCNIDDLIVIERQSNGTSVARKPHKELPQSLIEELGLQELYISKLL
jgi:predicted ATPase